jgi:hypothetical protein
MNRSEIRKATKLLPPWFTKRMMTDSWCFGLHLVTCEVMVIETIRTVHKAADGTLWIDVAMRQEDGLVVARDRIPSAMLLTLSERVTASVNVAHIVAADELCYS